MSTKPIIVLVRPQLGENIGKAARAMLNFGLTEMRIVNPRDGWPNPDAGPSAAGADLVLEQAQIFETTAEAVADCNQIYATTVRKRGMTKEVLTPQAAACFWERERMVGARKPSKCPFPLIFPFSREWREREKREKEKGRITSLVKSDGTGVGYMGMGLTHMGKGSFHYSC